MESQGVTSSSFTGSMITEARFVRLHYEMREVLMVSVQFSEHARAFLDEGVSSEHEQ